MDNKSRHGGWRPGAGRPKGRLNQRTIARQAAASLLPFNDDPVQWLLALVFDDRQDIRLRGDAARAVMPYVHPRC